MTKDQIANQAQQHSLRAHEVGTAVNAIARLMEENKNRATGVDDQLESPFLNDIDEWGLISALKIIGRSSCDLCEEIDSFGMVVKGKSSNEP